MAWLWARFGEGGGRSRRGVSLAAGRGVGGRVGRWTTRGPTTARARRFVGRSSRRRRWGGIPRRGRRRCIEIWIVVTTGIGGRRGTGAAAANGAFAFGHSKTASGTVGSVPIWKGARRHSRHEDMQRHGPNVRCPCRARDARRARMLRVALDGSSRAVALAGRAVLAFRYRGVWDPGAASRCRWARHAHFGKRRVTLGVLRSFPNRATHESCP